MERGSVDVVIGLQRGDEGKGRIVDHLAASHDVVARFNGGHNTGHTISSPLSGELTLHQAPAGVAYPGKANIIGPGVLLEPVELLKEINYVREAGLEVSPDNLAVSDRAALNLPIHALKDALREGGEASQGSTKRGIAYAAADKYVRCGAYSGLLRQPDQLKAIADELITNSGLIRVIADHPSWLAEYKRWLNTAPELAPYLADTVSLIHEHLEKGKKVLAEGAQAFLLDIDHGPGPYVTSSHTTTGGVLTGLGVGPHYIDRVVGVAKAVTSHVGGGPFVTEIPESELTERLRGKRGEIDSEFGKSTGRPRRLGYPDLVPIRQGVRVNGVTEMALTKFDHLKRYGKSVLVAVSYDYDGKKILHTPGLASDLDRCSPNYEELELWEQDISGIRKRSELPKPAQKLLEFIEEQVGVAITMVGVGPARDEIIYS